MPFPYATPSELEREITYSANSVELSENEWHELLTDKLKQESERVDGYTGTDFRTETEAPWIIKAAVIRLTRSVLAQIEEDGLTAESVSDRSENYRPPSEIRSEVRLELADAGYSDGETSISRNSNRTITMTGGSE